MINCAHIIEVQEEMERANEEHRQKIEANKEKWIEIAEHYGYSVKPLMAELAAEGSWPTRKRVSDGVEVPIGYQQVYKAERTLNIKGVGHQLNSIAKLFSTLKPMATRLNKKELE